VDEAALDDGFRIGFPYRREDCRSSVDNESIDAVQEGIPKDFQIADDFFLSLFPAYTEPNGLPDAVSVVREEDFPSRKGISVDHQATDVLECFVNMQYPVRIEPAADV